MTNNERKERTEKKMKKFNLAKVLSLVFVCVMLVGVLALTAFATTDPVVEIKAANVFYGETYQVMLAVNAPDGAVVTAKDSKGNDIEVVAFEENPTKVVDGVECKVYILTEGVAPQAINEVITLAVEYNGTTVTKNYSVFQYIYERLYVNNIAEGAEREMFNALIDYANKANVYFNEDNSMTTSTLLAVKNMAIGGVNPTGMYKAGELSLAEIVCTLDYDSTLQTVVYNVSLDGAAVVEMSLDEVKAIVVENYEAITIVPVLNDHEHSYSEKVTAPTCTEAGYTTYTCACGDSYTGNNVEATGHSYTDGVCDVCGESDPDYAVEMTITEALAAELGTKVVVSGTVCEIKDPWSESYGNISVYITDTEGNKLLCYRMSKNVVKGDIITVTGVIGEYNGAIQLAQGCTAEITGHDKSYDVTAVEVTIAEALGLADGTDIIVTGTVIKINTPWNSGYGNISVTIKDESGKELYLYRLATNVALNNIITVTGSITTYGGSRQIAAGATAEIIGTHTCSKYSEATCLAPATCVICGATTGELGDHNYVEGVCSVCGHEEGTAEVTYATEKFDIAASAGTLSGDSLSISWASNNFNFLGEKGSSTTNIRTSDSDHFRIYAASQFTISGNNGQEISKIVVKCTSSAYATTLVNSLESVDGVSAEANSTSVTITADSTVTSISFKASAQIRVSSFEITYVEE